MGKTVSSRVRSRRDPVAAEDFKKAAAKRLTFVFNEKAGNEDGWNRFVPVSPSMAAHLLLQGLPRTTKVTLSVEENGNGDIEIDAPGILNDSRSFDLTRRFLTAGFITVDRAHQEKGYGRTIMRNLIEFFHACGVNRFNITAGSTNGGYTWARLGFLPDGDEWAESLRHTVKDRYRLLKDFLPQAEKEAIKAALDSRKAKKVWDIADLRFDIAPALANVYEKSQDQSLSPRKRACFLDLRKKLESEFLPKFNYADYVRKPFVLPLGRALLTGTGWEAVMKFKDAKQMERVGTYVGGWRYLEIK